MVAAIGGYRANNESSNIDFQDRIVDAFSKFLDRIGKIWDKMIHHDVTPGSSFHSSFASESVLENQLNDEKNNHHYLYSEFDPETDPSA